MESLRLTRSFRAGSPRRERRNMQMAESSGVVGLERMGNKAEMPAVDMQRTGMRLSRRQARPAPYELDRDTRKHYQNFGDLFRGLGAV